jgi:hypothetical protein
MSIVVVWTTTSPACAIAFPVATLMVKMMAQLHDEKIRKHFIHPPSLSFFFILSAGW